MYKYHISTNHKIYITYASDLSIYTYTLRLLLLTRFMIYQMNTSLSSHSGFGFFFILHGKLGSI